MSGTRLTGLTLLLGSLLLLGCARRVPPPDETPPDEVEPIRPTLISSWAELTPTLYREVTGAPPTVEALSALHDTGRWTRHQRHWGRLEVLEFLDTDRPTRATGAVAAWFLRVVDEVTQVEAVLLRDFLDAPQAADYQELLLGLGEALAPPWDVCRPSDEAFAGLLIAWDGDRGLKLALKESKDPASWIVDHIEFVSEGVLGEDWWSRKGYGTCAAVGSINANGRFKPAREAVDAAAPQEPAPEG